MDSRCPRQLDSLPEEWCSLAVIRLKALRTAGRELTEEEEFLLPGCPYAMSHQSSCYCFFKYLVEYLDETSPPSDVEIASALSISIDTVKKIEKKALEKVKNSDLIQSIRSVYEKGEGVLDSTSEDIIEYNVVI